MSSPSWASVPGPRAGSNPPCSMSRSRRKAMFRPAPRSPTVNGKSGWSRGRIQRGRRPGCRIPARVRRSPRPSAAPASRARPEGSSRRWRRPARRARTGATRVASQSRSTSTSSSAKTTISPVASSSPLLRAFERPGSGSCTTRTGDVAVEVAVWRCATDRVGLRGVVDHDHLEALGRVSASQDRAQRSSAPSRGDRACR